MAFIRIGLVALLAGVFSYFVNSYEIKKAVYEQLNLSTQERLQRESLPFKEIKAIHKNYLKEFKNIYAQPERCKELARNFDRYFYIRKKDNSYQERPEIFNGTDRINGQDFRETSASFPPNYPLTEDIKVRFSLTFELTHKYGKVTENLFFDLFASIPEGGWTNHWIGHHDSEEEDYLSPDFVKVEDLEWFQLSYQSKGPGSSFTKMYFDDIMKIWMVSLLSYDEPNADGKQLYSVGTDFVLDQLIKRTAKPSIPGSKAIIFCNDTHGTLIYHPDKIPEIQNANGNFAIQSLNDNDLLPVLNALQKKTKSDTVTIIDTKDTITAFGLIPETDWCMAIQYPKVLMRPAIFQNLLIVASLCLFTLLVELIILRSILQNHVAQPLAKLLSAIHELGISNSHIDHKSLPISSTDEIGDLARDFVTMADRIQKNRDNLESTVALRTLELELAKNTAISANLAKSIFLANMSHEIRTPMHGILGMANNFRRSGVTPQQADKLAKMDASAHHLLGIINSILDLSKIEAGKLTLDEMPLDIKSIFVNVTFILSDSANAKGIELITEIQDLPSNLLGDANRIQQALINYTTNAIKFTDKGKVTLRVNKIEESSESILLRFEVQDSGIGILAETLPRLFKAFEQADNSTTRKYGGTGLGLAITQRLAELMGGITGVESTPSVGSTFWFTARIKKMTVQPIISPLNSQTISESLIKKQVFG